MLIRRKKSLSFLFLGIALFVFTLTISRPGLSGTRTDKKTIKNNLEPMKKTPVKFGTETSPLVKNRGKTHYGTKKHEHSPLKGSKIIQNRSSSSSLDKKGKTLSKQVFLQMQGPQASNKDLKRRFPTVIILGVKKAGTRALLDALQMHPKVIGAPNEVYFFNGFHTRGFEWYRQQMPLSSQDQITIEKSPTYFTSVEKTQAVNRMFVFSRSMRHALKLLVVVRDPTKRCLSEYTDILARSRKNKIPTVKGRFESLVLNKDGSVNASSSLVKTGLYINHLKEWLNYFPKNELHFVSGEGLVKKPYKEIKAVEKFLELEPFFTERNFRFDKKKGFPCFVPGNSNDSYCLPPNKGRTHAHAQENTLQLLRDFYRPYNRQFYNRVQRNFFWS